MSVSLHLLTRPVSVRQKVRQLRLNPRPALVRQRTYDGLLRKIKAADHAFSILAAPRRGARKDAVALGLRRGAPLRPLTGCGPFLSGAVYSHWSCQARWMALPPIAMCPPLIRIGDSQHLLLCTRFGQLFRGGARFFRSFQPMIELVEGDLAHLVCSLHSGGSATIVSQPLGPVSYAQRSG
jgi:hypothetical protein